MKIVEIIWHDSCAAGGDWEVVENLHTMDTGECRSVGYLVKRDRHKIILVQSLGKGGQTLLNVVAIPRGCVEEIKELST